MSQVPRDPPIYHITHVGNLPSILREGGLWCDAQRLARKLTSTNIGHLHIKRRRLHRPVKVQRALAGARHRPIVTVRPGWYY